MDVRGLAAAVAAVLVLSGVDRRPTGAGVPGRFGVAGAVGAAGRQRRARAAAVRSRPAVSSSYASSGALPIASDSSCGARS